MPTRTVSEHQQYLRSLLGSTVDTTVETVAVRAALDRSAATDIHSPIDLPIFRNSAMDGYAVRAQSLVGAPVTLPVVGTVAAGDQATALPAGAAWKIMTGAPLPEGADCVVPVEDTALGDGEVTIHSARAAGDFVREAGADVRCEELLLSAGTPLSAHRLAALAAVGIRDIAVLRRIRAAVITTGAELVAPDQSLGPGQIYNSNGVALEAALTADGAEVVFVGHSNDDPDEFRTILEAAVACSDVVCTTGGVSMGDFEVVKQTLEPVGGNFCRVAVQPGGPQGSAVLDGTAVLCFPGNPVSTLVSYIVFARPILRELAGLPPVRVGTMPLCSELLSPAGRRQFHRGRSTPEGVEVVSGPGSHLIAGMARAELLIDIPEEVTRAPAGSTVAVWPL